MIPFHPSFLRVVSTEQFQPSNLGAVFHQGHSSVAVNEYGHFVEIRRGFKRHERIDIPCVWLTFQQWSEFVSATDRSWFLNRPIREDWNADQQLVADFTEGSNLRIEPITPDRFERVQQAASRAHVDYTYYPSIENHNRVVFWTNKQRELNRDIQLGCEYVPSGRARILAADRDTGILKPVYMHLETGVLATSNNAVGYSFQDLGLNQPQSIYANAFGEYFQLY